MKNTKKRQRHGCRPNRHAATPPPLPNRVRDCLGDEKERAFAVAEWCGRGVEWRGNLLRALSPAPTLGKHPGGDAYRIRMASVYHLEATFRVGECCLAFSTVPNLAPTVEAATLFAVRPIWEQWKWNALAPYDEIDPNPVTAGGAHVEYPFVDMALDGLPLDLQTAFWRNFLSRSNFAPYLLSLVYDGKQSIHGLLFVGAADLATWQRRRDDLAAFFANDAEARYRATFRDRTPIAGRRHGGTGAVQTLLYLNPKARAGTMYLTRHGVP